MYIVIHFIGNKGHVPKIKGRDEFVGLGKHRKISISVLRKYRGPLSYCRKYIIVKFVLYW